MFTIFNYQYSLQQQTSSAEDINSALTILSKFLEIHFPNYRPAYYILIRVWACQNTRFRYLFHKCHRLSCCNRSISLKLVQFCMPALCEINSVSLFSDCASCRLFLLHASSENVCLIAASIFLRKQTSK